MLRFQRNVQKQQYFRLLFAFKCERLRSFKFQSDAADRQTDGADTYMHTYMRIYAYDLHFLHSARLGQSMRFDLIRLDFCLVPFHISLCL